MVDLDPLASVSCGAPGLYLRLVSRSDRFLLYGTGWSSYKITSMIDDGSEITSVHSSIIGADDGSSMPDCGTTLLLETEMTML